MAKTLKELADAVHQGLELASADDLAALFAEEPVEPTGPTPAEPSEPGTTPPEPQNPAPIAPEPAPQAGQAILDSLPEKFKDKDEATSVKKLVKSYTELEGELSRRSQELSEIQRYVQSLMAQASPRPPAQPHAGQPQQPQEPVDDVTFLESPVEQARRIAREEAAKLVFEGVQAYDVYAERRRIVSEFRAQHPDFDSFRQEMGEVVAENPHYNQDITALPKIYEAAKRKAAAKLQSTGLQPAPAPALDVEKLTEEIEAKVRAKLAEEIRKRKNAQVGTPQGEPMTPTQRDAASRKPASTPEDAIWQAMLNSGPKQLEL